MKIPKEYRNKMFEELSPKEIQEILDFKDERTSDERFIDSLLESGEYEKRDVVCSSTGELMKNVVVAKEGIDPEDPDDAYSTADIVPWEEDCDRII